MKLPRNPLLVNKLKREIKRIADQITNPRAAIARKAARYLDSYNGFSYDFNKNGEKDLIEKFCALSPATIFDVGANLGEWTRLALSNFSKATVHSFEISEINYLSLTKNIQNERFFPNNLGLSNQKGRATYKDYGENSGLNTLILSSMYHDSHVPSRLLSAELNTGDDYCESVGINFIDFLKIDVEGAEHLVLSGFSKMLKSKLVRLIQFEYGYTSGDSKFLMRDFYEYFKSFGYITGRLKKGSITFDAWSYELNEFKSGPNYVAIRADDLELRQLLTCPGIFGPR
jgi:FkbM family methyltransferase